MIIINSQIYVRIFVFVGFKSLSHSLNKKVFIPGIITVVFKNNASNGIRTHDPQFTRLVLCH